MRRLGRFFSNIVFYGGLAAITGGTVYVLVPKYRQMTMLSQQRDELMRKIDDKKNEIETLKAQQRRFENDGDFVEFIARQHKRIRNNEFLFITVDE